MLYIKNKTKQNDLDLQLINPINLNTTSLSQKIQFNLFEVKCRHNKIHAC